MKSKLLLIFALACIIQPGFTESKKPINVFISGGGDWHPYAQCSGALIDSLGNTDQYVCTYSEDPDSLNYKNIKDYDVLMIYNGVYYEGKEGQQKEHTPHFIPPSLSRFVSEGGGLVVVHSAVASFSDWKGFINLTGGIWDWKKSAHDKYGVLKSEVVAPKHPILEGIPASFEFQDEFYHTLTFQSDIEVLIQSTHKKDGKQVTEPLAWVTKDTDSERAVTILHGHDMGSWGNETFQKLMTNAIEWAARRR